MLTKLGIKEGRGTELVSLYVPPGKQVSDVMNTLRQEYGTASNIKSTTTRKNVQDAIVKVQQRLKLFKRVPENGIVIFSGSIPQNGPGSERNETYIITPPEPISIYLYRCDSRFHTEHLSDLLREEDTYGILLIDASEATYATLHGRTLEIQRRDTSGVPGKTRAGGQSARRFERIREMRLLEYFKRIGDHANELFLSIEGLKGLIMGGPGPTKFDFRKGNYLNYMLDEKVIDVIDTAYVNEQGVKEIVDKAPDIVKKIRYVEEKEIVQKFLYEVGHDTGLATYGAEEIRKALEAGSVETLILSEELDISRVTVKCASCDYMNVETMRTAKLASYEEELAEKTCPKCRSPTLASTGTEDLIDYFAELAEQTDAGVEMISDNTEEGEMLKKSFGGIAAILRFKTR
jgi:peptide chain release factor subunit 1